jgi:hypothetical protein
MNPWENDPVVAAPADKPWLKDPVAQFGEAAKMSIMDLPGAIAKGAMELPGRIKEAAFPDRDPRFKDLESFNLIEAFPKEKRDPSPANTLNRMNAEHTAIGIEAITPEDSAYGDLIEQQLGPRFIGRTKDANGYEVLSYIDDNGKRKDAYINRPGLDLRDIDRASAQMVPAALATKIPLLRATTKPGAIRAVGSAVKQGIGQGAASVGVDAAAGLAGADQDIDTHRALFAAVGGAGGELLNAGLGKIAEVFKVRKLFKGGDLTPKGRTLAETYGINPDELSDVYKKQFAKDMVTAENKTAAAAKASLQNRGFAPTTAQLTKHPDDIRLERDVMAGDFNTRTTNHAEDLRLHMEEQKNKLIPTSIKSQTEKEYGVTDTSRTAVGEEVASGVRTKYSDIARQEKDAWDNVDTSKLVPEQIDRQILHLKFQELKTDNPKLFDKLLKLDPELQPNAVAAMRQIEDVVKGKAKTGKFGLLGYQKTALVDLETIRRRLAARRDRAFNTPGGGSDFNATNDIMDVYNDYLEVMATKAQFPEAVNLMKARDLSKQLRSTFGTTGDPAMDPGGRFIKNLIDNQHTSPEEIARRLLDGKDAGAAWDKLNTIFSPGADELKLIKAAAFEQVFMDPKTGMLKSFSQIGKTYANKTERYSSVYKKMFSPEELKTIDRYVSDIRKLEMPKVGGKVKSGLGQEMERIRRDGMLKYFLRRRGQAATFQSKPTESFLWQWSARTKAATPMYSIGQATNANRVRKLKEGYITKGKSRIVPPSVSAPIGGMIGQKYGAE